ncbi:MAG: GNAT family N-acetyltransferase [Bacilli bacterium]
MIRKATQEDLETLILYNLYLAQETENLTLDPAIVKQGVNNVLEDPLKGCYWVDERNQMIVGQLLITYEWSDWRNATWWWIQSVYTHPQYRGQGVFTSLYAYIDQLVKTNPHICGIRLTVDRMNNSAQKTYQRLGMAHSHYDLYESFKGKY